MRKLLTPLLFIAFAAPAQQTKLNPATQIDWSKPVSAASVNTVINANQQAGADIGAKLNNALNACLTTLHSVPGVNNYDGSPAAITDGCSIDVESAPASIYSFSTPIVLPAPLGGTLRINFHGAALQYSGSGIAIDVQGGATYNVQLDGLNLTGNPNATGGIRFAAGAGFALTNSDIHHFNKAGAFGVQFNGTDTSEVVHNNLHDNWDSLQSVVGSATGYSPNAVTVQRNHFYGDLHVAANMIRVGANLNFEYNTFDPPAPQAVAFAYFGGGTVHFEHNYLEGVIAPSGTLGFAVIFGLEPYGSTVVGNYFGLTYSATFKAPVLLDTNNDYIHVGCFHSIVFRDNKSGGADSEFVDQVEDCGANNRFESNGIGYPALGTTLIARTGDGTALSTYSTSTTAINIPPILSGQSNQPAIPFRGGAQLYGDERGWHIPWIVRSFTRCDLTDNSGHSAEFGGAGYDLTVRSFIACQDGSFNGVVNATNGATASGNSCTIKAVANGIVTSVVCQ